MSQKIEVKKIVKTTFISLISFELLMILGDLIFNFFRFTRYRLIQHLFNVAREDSFCNWYSSVQTFLVGLILAGIYWIQRAKNISGWKRRGWGILSLFFIYLAVDDGNEIHERLGGVLKYQWEFIENFFSFWPTYSWHFLFGPIFGGMAIFMIFYLRKEMKIRKLRNAAFSGLGCYVFSVGMDFVEGLGVEPSYSFSHFCKVTEEFLEMAGSTFFLVAFLGVLIIEFSNLFGLTVDETF